MSRSAVSILLCSATLALSGCAATSLSPTSIALKYHPTEEPSATPPVHTCAALSRLKVEDARTAKDPGRRVLEGKPEVAQPIYLAADPMPWFEQAVALHFKRAGLLTTATDKPSGLMRLEQIVMSETVRVRADYNGRVTLSLDLLAPTTGRTCWSARVTGFAENAGYAGSAENYNETLNQALDKALIQLLSTGELSANLCGKCNGP
jgi:hypothetical protein